jgi:hypothetical protein
MGNGEIGVIRGRSMETHLILCTRVRLLTEPEVHDTLEHCDRLGKMLHRLIRSLQSP